MRSALACGKPSWTETSTTGSFNAIAELHVSSQLQLAQCHAIHLQAAMQSLAQGPCFLLSLHTSNLCPTSCKVVSHLQCLQNSFGVRCCPTALFGLPSKPLDKLCNQLHIPMQQAKTYDNKLETFAQLCLSALLLISCIWHAKYTVGQAVQSAAHAQAGSRVVC